MLYYEMASQFIHACHPYIHRATSKCGTGLEIMASHRSMSTQKRPVFSWKYTVHVCSIYMAGHHVWLLNSHYIRALWYGQLQRCHAFPTDTYLLNWTSQQYLIFSYHNHFVWVSLLSIIISSAVSIKDLESVIMQIVLFQKILYTV
jgi:hypothetical protein